MDSGRATESRNALRRQLIALRKAMSPARRGQLDAAIRARLESWVAEKDCRSIAIYSPIRHEPDLLELAARWRSEGRVTSVPVMMPGLGQPRGALVFGRFDELTRWEVLRFGVSEPAEPVLVEPDLIVAPCVGFCSARGKLWRLGYGGGYYDRTQAWRPVPMVGVAYDEAEVIHLAPTATDAPLVGVITPSRRIGPGSA